MLSTNSVGGIDPKKSGGLTTLSNHTVRTRQGNDLIHNSSGKSGLNY